jgi:hypothetical protein
MIGKWFGPPQLNLDDQPSAADDWSGPEKFPRQTDPVASWLDDVGVLPFAIDPAPSGSLAADDEVTTERPRATEWLFQPAAPAPLEPTPAPTPPCDVAASVAPTVDVAAPVDPWPQLALAEAPVDPWAQPLLTGDDLSVPQLTATSRSWIGLVVGGVAIVCAFIGILAIG